MIFTFQAGSRGNLQGTKTESARDTVTQYIPENTDKTHSETSRLRITTRSNPLAISSSESESESVTETAKTRRGNSTEPVTNRWLMAFQKLAHRDLKHIWCIHAVSFTRWLLARKLPVPAISICLFNFLFCFTSGQSNKVVYTSGSEAIPWRGRRKRRNWPWRDWAYYGRI